MEPQINADERRFVDRDFHQYSKDGKPQSSDSKLLAIKHENGTRNSTRMTRIGRIFTDIYYLCVSVQSVFYRTDYSTKSTIWEVSALIRVLPRFFFNANFQYCDTPSRNNTGFERDGYRLAKLNLWGLE